MVNRSRLVCNAPTCGNTKAKRPDLSFFSVPRAETIWKQWLINGGREDLFEKTPEYAHNNIYFCGEHFEDDQFVSILKRNRLEIGAVPTIFKHNKTISKKLDKKINSKKQDSKENKNAEAKSLKNISNVQKEG